MYLAELLGILVVLVSVPRERPLSRWPGFRHSQGRQCSEQRDLNLQGKPGKTYLSQLLVPSSIAASHRGRTPSPPLSPSPESLILNLALPQ